MYTTIQPKTWDHGVLATGASNLHQNFTYHGVRLLHAITPLCTQQIKNQQFNSLVWDISLSTNPLHLSTPLSLPLPLQPSSPPSPLPPENEANIEARLSSLPPQLHSETDTEQQYYTERQQLTCLCSDVHFADSDLHLRRLLRPGPKLFPCSCKLLTRRTPGSIAGERKRETTHNTQSEHINSSPLAFLPSLLLLEKSLIPEHLLSILLLVH